MEQTFFNDNAFDVCVWSYEEKNRLKASRIYKAALNMEEKYRKYHGIPPKCNRLVGLNAVTFGKSELTAKIKAKFKTR